MIAQDETAPTEAPAETGDMDLSDIRKKKKKDLPMDLVRDILMYGMHLY